MRNYFCVPALLALILSTPAPHVASAQEKSDVKPPDAAKPAAPYARASDKPLEPKEELIKEADDHRQFRVEFNGIKGDRVPAYLYVPKPKADAKPAPAPAILLQYGTGGNKNTNYIVAIGKQFVAAGYVVLTIDSPNCGERRGKDKKASGILGLLGADQVMHYCGDYGRAIDFLCTRPEADKDRLGYVGISWGAITGITYTAYDPRIKAVGSMVGGGNFLGQYSPKADKTPAALKNSDPVFHVGQIAPRPLLFINVTKDQLILKSWADSLHKAAGPGAKVIWLETDHYFKGLDRSKICDSVIEFMDKELAAKK